MQQAAEREIRALYTESTITVYQAYRPEIARPAVAAQTFVPPFKMERMTWIKPSFLWMQYRSGWASKPGQEHVLAIEITREGWEWALQQACLSHYNSQVHGAREAWKTALQTAPVRLQWDPEKDLHLQNLPHRSIQIGLTGIAVNKYVQEWIVAIRDISSQCREMHQLIQENRAREVAFMLPEERVYPLSDKLKQQICAT